MHLVSVLSKQRAVYTGYPSKCRVCIGNCLGCFMPMYSVCCRPGVHWWSIHMASPVVWIRQLSGASLVLSHLDLVRYRCYKGPSVNIWAQTVTVLPLTVNC